MKRRHGESEVPEHPCLELIANSEEKLQTSVSRRLITMRKKAAYDPSWGTVEWVRSRKTAEYKEFCRESIRRNNISYVHLKEFVGRAVHAPRLGVFKEGVFCLFSTVSEHVIRLDPENVFPSGSDCLIVLFPSYCVATIVTR